MKKRHFDADKFFWGFCFLAGAVALILSKLDYLPSLALIQIVLTIFFLWTLIKGLIHVSFGEILFSLAFLACIYDEILGITELTPWTVLGAALLGTIGLSLLFPRKRSRHIRRHPEMTPEVIDVPDDQIIQYENSFGSSIKYINSDNFQAAYLKCSFGEMKAYFDNAVIRQGNAQVKLKVSFGSMALYVPKTWQVIDNTSVSFGDVDFKNADRCQHQPDGPVLYLTGEVSFGSAVIFYI